MARSSTRARALGLARRLAAGALQRLAREVDRLSLALEPMHAAIPLREPGRFGEHELEVTRTAGPRAWSGAEDGASAQGSRDARSERGLGRRDATGADRGSPAAEDPSATSDEAGAEASAFASPARSTEENGPEFPSAVPDPPAPAVPSPTELPPALAQAEQLRARIEPQLALLRERTPWAESEDPVEALRRRRVASRRLRSFVRLFAPMLGDKRARKLDRRLRALTRALGPVREWDVLLAGLRALHADAEPLTRAALEHVTEWAEGRRAKAERRATEALAAVDAEALAAALEAELDRVCGRLLRVPEDPTATATALLELELRRAFEDMPDPRQETDVDELHEIRIRAKRLRYALELLQPALPEHHRGLRPRLRRAQDTIGDHREAAQLVERLQGRRAALDARGLHTLASALGPVEAAVTHRRQRAFERAMAELAELAAHAAIRPTDAPR